MCALQVFANTSHALTRLTDMIDFAPHEPGRKAAEALLSHGMRLQKSFDRDATRRRRRKRTSRPSPRRRSNVPTPVPGD